MFIPSIYPLPSYLFPHMHAKGVTKEIFGTWKSSPVPLQSHLSSKLKTTSSAAQLTTYIVWWCICRPKLVSDKCAGAGLYVAKSNRAKWTCTLFYVVTRGGEGFEKKCVFLIKKCGKNKCISCEMKSYEVYQTWRRNLKWVVSDFDEKSFIDRT